MTTCQNQLTDRQRHKLLSIVKSEMTDKDMTLSSGLTDKR